MMQTNQVFGQGSAAFEAGRLMGQVFVWLLLIALAAKGFSIARRPSANKRCALSLGIFFSSLIVASLAGTVAQHSPALRILVGLGGLVACAGIIVGVVLAIVGLAEYGSQPDKYTQGRAQAIWTLSLASVFLCLVAVTVLRNFQQGHAIPQAVTANQPEAGQWLAFDDLNFKIRAPAKPWVQLDAKKLNKAATVAFGRASPQVLFMIIAEKTGRRSTVTAESVVEIAKGSLRSGMDSLHVLSQAPMRRQELDGVQMESEGQNQSYHILFRHWICVTNGYVYQLAVWGSFENADMVRSSSEELFSAFTLMDYRRQAAPFGNSADDFHSGLFEYSVEMSGSGLRPSPVMAKNFPAAEFTAWDVQKDVGLVVIPISLMEQHPPAEALTQAMAGLFGAAYPGPDIQDEKPITQGELSGVEFGFERAGTDGNLAYRVKVLKGRHCAYSIGAFSLSQQKADPRRLEEVLDHVKFPAQPASIPNLPSKFTARENHRHGLVFNGIGLVLYNARQYEQSAVCFRIAFDFERNSALFLQNVANADVKAGLRQEALQFLQGNPSLLATNQPARATEAYLQSQLQQVDNALTNFGALFTNGYRNDDYFVDYISLLNQTRQWDTALAAVEDYLRDNDSVAVRLVEARLYLQKRNFTNAIALLKVQSRKYPYNAELSLTLAEAYNQATLYAEAVGLCEQLIGAQSDSAEAYYVKGCGEFGLKRYREAKASFEAALRMAPANANAKSYLDLVSGMLGQGSNSGLKDPIAPVPIPEKLLNAPPVEADASYTKDYGAQYLKQITAISFARNKEFKRTDYMAIKVLDASGIAAFSTVQFGFDPLSEGIFVNDLKVKDEEGKVVASGKVDDYYVVDAASATQASQQKVLNIPISGLRPGCRVELTVTRQDLAPPEEFPFTAHACVTSFPILEDILFIRGETNTLKFAGLDAERGSNGEGGLYWVRRQPPVYKWEPMEPSPAEFAPMLCVGDSAATWDGEARKYLGKLAEYLQLDQAGRALAGELATKANSESEKIFSLARYVQSRYTYKALEFGRRARIPHSTAEIIHNQYGDCKDHSLLLQQMLEASGIPARLALVKTQGKVRKELPSLDQFDHMLVYLPGFQNGFFIDCTAKGADLTQTPPLGLAGKEALVLDSTHPRFVAIPDYAPGSTTLCSRRDVSITNGNDVVVHEVLSLKGVNGSALRSYFKDLQLAARRRFVDVQLNRLSGEMTSFELRNLADTQAPLVMELDYVLKRQFHQAGHQLVGRLPDVWEQLYASAEPVERRTTPFELSFPIDVESTIHLATPEGYRAPALEDFRQNLSMAFASSSAEAQLDGPGLRIDYRLQRRAGHFTAAEYGPYQENMVKALGPLEQTVAFTEQP